MSTTQFRREFEDALPRIRTHALIVFRHVTCVHRKADLVAETIALAWKWWRGLVARGKRPWLFVTALATFAARAARCGRRVCGHEKKNDTMSPTAQRLHGFNVRTLPVYSTLSGDPLAEALYDNRHTPVPEQVAFRFDFPAWLRTYDCRKRQIIEDMAMGTRTQDLAVRFGLSPGRVSQLRREFFVAWLLFTGED
jgi:hypothetical protein